MMMAPIAAAATQPIALACCLSWLPCAVLRAADPGSCSILVMCSPGVLSRVGPGRLRWRRWRRCRSCWNLTVDRALAAIADQHLSGDVAGLAGGEEHDAGGNLCGLAHPPGRDAAEMPRGLRVEDVRD